LTKIDFLKWIRKNVKMSVDRMSELTDIPARTIGAYERGERPFTSNSPYALALAALFGINPAIFDLEEITDDDIQRHKLTKFASALRLYMYWSGLNDEDIVQKSKHSLNSDDIHNMMNDTVSNNKFVVYANYENIEISDERAIYYRNDKQVEILLAINTFKPSSFGIFENNYLIDFDKLLTHLEKNGLELTRENVKKSLIQGVIINEDSIKKVLEVVEKNDILKSDEVLELLELLPKYPAVLKSCLDKLKELDKIANDI